jgi:hypothetical protein
MEANGKHHALVTLHLKKEPLVLSGKRLSDPWSPPECCADEETKFLPIGNQCLSIGKKSKL